MKGNITGWKALFIRHVDMMHGSPEVKERVFFFAWHGVLYILMNVE